MSKAPVAVVMITLNEGHNMTSVLDNIQDWAEEIFLVDSFSVDDTVDIALQRGVHVVQRQFRGFGDQWNFALQTLPIKSPWTMKLDPDERLTDELKQAITCAIQEGDMEGISLRRHLWFMGKSLPVRQTLLRVWRTNKCYFSDVLVNEYPQVGGKVALVNGDLEHHDSPDLHHWYNKQNKYSTAEAITTYRGLKLAGTPKLFGNALQRRMWLKKRFYGLPFRYGLLFMYLFLYLGAWRAGKVGYIWAKLRVGVYRAIDYKVLEMRTTGREPVILSEKTGETDHRVEQF